MVRIVNGDYNKLKNSVIHNSQFTIHNSPFTIHHSGDRIVFAGIILLLIFAPFAFGSVHVWAYTLVETGVFFLLILFFINRVAFSGEHVLTWVKTPVNLVLILFVLLIVLQLVPFPSFLVRIISPRTFADKIQFAEIMNTAEGTSAKGIRWMCLAYYMHPVILELLKLGAYLGMFFLVLNTVKSEKRINILIYLLLLLGLFESAYALVSQVLTEDPVVWWWRKTWRGAMKKAFFQNASGTFIGSNHFAFYMEMVILLCSGFIISQIKTHKKFASGRGFRSYTQRILNWFAPDSPVPKMFFLLLCIMFMGSVFLLSRSRGGILSMAIAMFLVSGIFFLKKGYRKYGIMILSFFLIMLSFGLYFGIGPTLGKFTQSRGLYLRLYTTETMLPMLRDYPLAGVGWGNFYHLYPRYVPDDAPDDFEGAITSGHSHNDWIEAGTETGFAGLILMFSAYIGFLVKITRTWLGRRKDLYALGIGAGVTALLISIGVHSFFDFNMHIPGNPLTLSAVLGLGYAAVHRKGKDYSESFSYKTGEISLTFLRRIIIVLLAVFIFMLAIVAAGRHFMAEINCATEHNSTLRLNINPDLGGIQKAISYNPLNPEYISRLAGYYILGKGSDGNFVKGIRNESNEKAITIMKKAVCLNPANGNYWHVLGELYAKRNRYYNTGEFLTRSLYIADQCYDAGIRYSQTDVHMMFKVAIYWVWRSKLIPLSDDSQVRGLSVTREQGIRKFQETFQRVLYLDPARWQGSAEIIWRRYPDAAVVSGIVPPGDEKLKSLVMEWIGKKTGGKNGF